MPGCPLSVIYLCPSLQSPGRPGVSVLGGTGGNVSVSPGAARVAAFALKVACGAELGTQHTLGVGQGGGQAREHLLGAPIPTMGAIICVPEVQKQAEGLGGCEQKAARLACVL